MDNRVGELSLRDIFTEALVLGILVTLKILVIISDLEDNSQKVNQRHTVPI